MQRDFTWVHAPPQMQATFWQSTLFTVLYFHILQSGASSPAKHGDAYFSAVYGSIQDPIAAPGPYENQEP